MIVLLRERATREQLAQMLEALEVYVKVAVDMVSLACDKRAKEIILGSSDSDLQPAIKEVRNRNVSCIYIGFESMPNKGISFTTNKTILIRNSEILEFERIQPTLLK